MKNLTKIALTTSAITVTAALAPALQANEITGSIGFGSLGVTLSGGTGLQTASSFTVSSPFITTESGIYSSVPVLTSVTFSGFEFNPAVASVSPLWTFNVGSMSYSFEATTVSSYFNAALDEWDIGGQGIASATGYSDTPGTWNVNLSQSGATVVFDSSAAGIPPSVPDGGSTLMLLGGGCVGLAGFSRKRAR